MATAATMRRYLNTPEGAVYGFAPDPPHGLPTLGSERGVATTILGLWLASAYGGAGGFTGSMLTGMLGAQAAMNGNVGAVDWRQLPGLAGSAGAQAGHCRFGTLKRMCQ